MLTEASPRQLSQGAGTPPVMTSSADSSRLLGLHRQDTRAHPCQISLSPGCLQEIYMLKPQQLLTAGQLCHMRQVITLLPLGFLNQLQHSLFLRVSSWTTVLFLPWAAEEPNQASLLRCAL